MDMSVCRPFYLFKEHAYIYDISEDDYRAANGLCKREDVRRYPDKSLIDVWDLVDGDLSKVGINGQSVYRVDLRKSVTIKDRFRIDHACFLNKLFDTVKVGIGSKHIYTVGDFMAPHRDTRLPDLNGLPHVMTLVVLQNRATYMGGELLVNGENVLELFNRDENADSSDIMILFPITSLHEVKQIAAGSRHSFVFPVYGRLDIFNRIFRTMSPCNKYTTTFDEVLISLDKMLRNDYTGYDVDEFHGALLGKINTLNDVQLSRQFVKCLNILGYFVPTERAHGVPDDYEDSSDEYTETSKPRTTVTYLLNNAWTTHVVHTTFKVPATATQITVDQVSETTTSKYTVDDRLEKIRNKVRKIQKLFNENVALNQEIAKKSQANITTLPNEVFVYAASSMYYSDAAADSLIGVDALVYQLATKAGRKVKHAFIPNLHTYVSASSIINVYYVKKGELVRITTAELLPDTEYINSLHAEHDDQGGYDCEFDRLHCCLVIGHADDLA
jgi:hypothetical protein